MNHPWFNNFPWSKLLEKTLEPPYIPYTNESDWVKNFDPDFTKQKATDSFSYVDPVFLEQFKKDFEMFNFK